MNKHTVLICDDNEAIHESLKKFLKEEGIHVISVFRGGDVSEVLEKNAVDLIVLDIMMPDISGTVVCREIRKSSNLPIIFLSAKDEELDRILGLELGADDYVTKPFSPREVTIRIKKLLSRFETFTPRSSIIRYEELSLNRDSYEVFVNNKRVEMTAKEVRLLAYFMLHPQKVLNREQILEAVWDYNVYCDTRAVDAVIKRIRQKLPEQHVHFSIQSVYGAGYRLCKTNGSSR